MNELKHIHINPRNLVYPYRQQVVTTNTDFDTKFVTPVLDSAES